MNTSIKRIILGLMAVLGVVAVLGAVLGMSSMSPAFADTITQTGTVTIAQKADPAGFPAQCNDGTAMYIVDSVSRYGGTPVLERSMDGGASWTDLGVADAGYPGHWTIMNRVNGAAYRVYSPAGSFSGVGGDTNTYSYTEAYSNVVTISCTGWDFGIPENDLPPGVTPPPCPAGNLACDPNAQHPRLARHLSAHRVGAHKFRFADSPRGTAHVVVQVKVGSHFKNFKSLPAGGGVVRFKASVRVVQVKVVQDSAGTAISRQFVLSRVH